jgi:hypothetical protein
LQTATLGYKLIKKIKDDRFDEENIHHYDLLIQFSVRDLQISIVDSTDQRVVFFEDFVFGEVNSHDELFNLFKSLFESHSLLLAGFWKSVKISVKNNKFVQVPASLFLEEAKAEYLQFNAQLDLNKEAFLHCTGSQSGAITIFSIQKDIFDWIKQLYSNTRLIIVHQACALIEGAIRYDGSGSSNRLYIYVDRFKLHIISIDKGKLIYYNQFIIKHFADYVKYIMLVLKGLSMDQQNSEVVLWGYIGKNSPHYLEFVKYIRNVSFGSRPTFLKFGYIFDEVQEHHFYDLFSTQLIKE